MSLKPPPTRREDVREIIHGVEVADPYRWLEDGASPETREWIAAQRKYTAPFLDTPERDRLRARFALWTPMSKRLPISSRSSSANWASRAHSDCEGAGGHFRARARRARGMKKKLGRALVVFCCRNSG
jgi:prolyl oligopeptidase PreP (S9A serine peptidase family)